jgi:hypothetical protein
MNSIREAIRDAIEGKFYHFKSELQPSILKRRLKFWYQRRTRGWDDSETWSLRDPIAEFITPRLKRFKKVSIAYPSDLETFEEWEEILEQMIWSFEYIQNDGIFGIEPFPKTEEEREKYYKRYDKGIHLFADYFSSLWW